MRKVLLVLVRKARKEYPLKSLIHYMKSVRIWSYSGPYFPALRLDTLSNN